jgi:uncharacterized protein YyaL (SSP411 family)
LNDDSYLQIAKKNADFLLTNLQSDDRLMRTWKDGQAKLDAYIEDHANLADGLLELYQADGDIVYLNEAKRLTDIMIAEFWDKENGGFYFTSHDHESLIVRNKDFTDNATPSGNSVAADVLLMIARITSDESYERYATRILSIAAKQARRYPQGFGRALSAMEFTFAPVKEIVIFEDKNKALANTVNELYLPNKIMINVTSDHSKAAGLPLVEGRSSIDGMPTAYVCEDMVCQRPVTEAEELRKMLSAR